MRDNKNDNSINTSDLKQKIIDSIETNQLMQMILEKTEENNALLKKMHRSIVWGMVTKILYWVIIIGVSLGSYYFIQPYINSVVGVYDSIKSSAQAIEGGAKSIQKVGTQATDLKSILSNFKK